MSGKEIPVFAWENTFAASALHLFGPAKFGGFGDVVTRARIQAEVTGRKVKDVIDEVCEASLLSFWKVVDSLYLVVSPVNRKAYKCAWAATNVRL